MKQLVCEMCGSTDLIKQDGVFVCQSCGCKYSVEEAKKMMVEGTVDVTGSTVKVDTSEELTNLYQLARRAKAEENSNTAAKYYEMILMKDPSSWEAAFYSAYYTALNCTIAQIESAANAAANSVSSVLIIISRTMPAEQASEPVAEIQQRACHLAKLLTQGSKNAYNQSASKNFNEYSQRCFASLGIAQTAGSVIYDLWKDCPWAWRLAVSADRTAYTLAGTLKSAIRANNLFFSSPAEKAVDDYMASLAQHSTAIYWLAHIEERTELENKRAALQSRMEKGKQLLEEMTAEEEAIGADLEPRLQALEKEKAALGVFKIKERKVLQEQITALEEERSSKRAAFRNSTIQVDGTEMSRDEYRRRFRTPLLYAEIARINKELEMERWGLDGETPIQKTAETSALWLMQISDICTDPRGVVISGTIGNGTVKLGQNVTINHQEFAIVGLEQSLKLIDTASTGMTVSMRLRGATENNFAVGDAVYLP